MQVPDNLKIRIAVEQLTTRARFSSLVVLAGASVAGLLGWTFWNAPNQTWLRPSVVALLSVYAILFVTFRSWLGTTDKPAALNRYHAITYTAQALCGLCWALCLCEMMAVADPAHRSALFGLAIGLMSASAFTGPILNAFAFWTPVTLGAVISLLMIGGPFQAGTMICLGAYAVISSFAIVFLNVRQTRQAVHTMLLIEENNELIHILLKDFEENSSDWVWETDATLTLQHVSPRFAEVAQRSAGELQMPLLRLIETGGDTPARSSMAVRPLADTLAQRLPFRDYVTPVMIRGERRYWSLSGKPIFDHHSAFLGYRGVGSDITAVQTARERVAYLARNDNLTGLANRVAFNEALDQGFGSDRAGRMALLYVDLDDFKGVNDTHGHAIGDALLAAFAGRVRRILRESDLAARLGGDEFAILMLDADATAANSLARRLVEAVARRFQFDDIAVEVGISVGIALAPEDGETPDQLCKAADLALYSAKSSGRGGSHFYDHGIDVQVQTKRTLQADLKRAISGGELSLAFQPIVELASQRIVAVEALVRWRHPGLGPQVPDSFIPAAEQSGLIVPLGAWVIREACRVAASLPPGIVVAINLSPVQLREDSLIGVVDAALAAHQLDASRLEFEITETTALENDSRTMDNLARLSDLGCGIALDDFGVGFSSLGSVLGFPFDKVKIDRSFVATLGANDRTAAIFKTIVYLGRQMEIALVAEGVETAAQAEIVRSFECAQAQGNYFARPLDEDAILALMARGAAALPPVQALGT